MGALSGIRRSASGLYRARPFITDLGNTGRTEFSGATFEQWVAKTSNYLEAEFGTELQLHVELRAHWMWPVIVAALDELEGTVVPRDRADLVMRIGTEPSTEIPVLALHDHPMAMPFGRPLPPLHHDFFLDVRSGGDTRSAGPVHELPLIDDGVRTWSAAELVAATTPFADEPRLGAFATLDPLTTVAEIVSLTVLPWASSASLVIANDHASAQGERITVELPIN
jgi:uncharacterized protein (TIGR03089 family)